MKKLLIAGAVLGVGYLVYASYKTVQDYASVLSQLKAWPTKIKSFKWINLSRARLVIDLKIENPTTTALSIDTASTAILKKVMVYMDGKQLGIIEVNRSGIEIPALGTTTIENLPLDFDPIGIGITVLQNGSNFDVTKLTAAAVVNVFGTDYLIKQ